MSESLIASRFRIASKIGTDATSDFFNSILQKRPLTRGSYLGALARVEVPLSDWPMSVPQTSCQSSAHCRPTALQACAPSLLVSTSRASQQHAAASGRMYLVMRVLERGLLEISICLLQGRHCKDSDRAAWFHAPTIQKLQTFQRAGRRYASCWLLLAYFHLAA